MHVGYILGWSEIGSKIFFLQFQLARYVKRCQYISRTLFKIFKIFEFFFDLPFQLFILQYYAVFEVMSSLASSEGSHLKNQLMQSNALIVIGSLVFKVTDSYIVM